MRDSKQLLQYFLYEELQIYVINYEYMKNFKVRAANRIFFHFIAVFCSVMNYNKAIYGYITYLWKESSLSKRKFSINHNIEESTLRDIINGKDYQISLPTIYKICESRSISLFDFFREIEMWNKSTKT